MYILYIIMISYHLFYKVDLWAKCLFIQSVASIFPQLVSASRFFSLKDTNPDPRYLSEHTILISIMLNQFCSHYSKIYIRSCSLICITVYQTLFSVLKRKNNNMFLHFEHHNESSLFSVLKDINQHNFALLTSRQFFSRTCVE